MPRALVFGGTSSIGLAIARRLLPNGWDVGLTGSAVLASLDGDYFRPMLDYAAEDRFYARSACA